MLDLEAAVDGDRVVDRAEQGEVALDAEQAVAEALVVVDDVELADAAAQVVPGPQAERERLGELAADEGAHLDRIGPVLDLPDAWHPHRVVVVVDVQAGQLDQRDPLVEHRVGLPAEHLDVVAEVGQRLGEVPDVDALAADMGLSPVREDRDAQLVGGAGAPVVAWGVDSRHGGKASQALDRWVNWRAGGSEHHDRVADGDRAGHPHRAVHAQVVSVHVGQRSRDARVPGQTVQGLGAGRHRGSAASA